LGTPQGVLLPDSTSGYEPGASDGRLSAQGQRRSRDQVIRIGPDHSIADAAKLIADNDVSALPVVDDDGRLVGIISEGDLMSREEIGAAAHHSW